MNQAILLNNKAVSSLQGGDAFEACNYLTEASGICLAIMDEKRMQKHRDHIITWVNFSPQNSSSSHFKGILNNNRNRRHNQSGGGQDDDDDDMMIITDSAENDESLPPPTMYHYAATVRTTCCRQSSNNPSHTATTMYCSKCWNDESVCPCSIAPIVWYNLALCCHLLGAELGGRTTNDGSFYLMRSIYLYEKVLNIYNRGNSGNGSSSAGRASQQQPQQGLSTLLMAVLNNSACIQHELKHFGQCEYLMGQLKQNLRRAASTTATSPSSPTRRPQRNWGIFHMNMIMMDSERPRPAAAA